MAFLPPTAEQDVCSIYLNLEACDPTDDQTTVETTLEPLPPLEFSLLASWNDMPITLPPLDLKGSREACLKTSPFLEPFPSMLMNDLTLLSSIEPSLVCSPSTNWLSTDDEEYIASDDTNSPSVRSRSLSPYPLKSYPMLDSYVGSINVEEFEHPVPLSSPSSRSVSLSATDSEYSSLFSPRISAMTSPASSVLSLDDSRRSCSVDPEISESASHLSSPSMRSRKAKEETGENHTGIITRDSRKSSLKGRRRQRRQNPISSRRASSRDPQDPDLVQPDQFFGPVVVEENGKDRPTCLCGKSFTRLSDLKRHNTESTSCPLVVNKMDGKKAKADPRFVCDRCGGSFSRYDSLDRHQKNWAACQRARQSQKKSLRNGEYDSDIDD